MIGICEQSGGSCQGPASRNGIATLLTTKGLLPDGGGIGYQWFNDRAGVHARTLADAARVLDALKDPATGYYDTRDPFTAIPRALVSDGPYASFTITEEALRKNPKPLQGMRIGILREHMVKRTPNHEAITEQLDREIKAVLRDRLGAELVESIAPDYPDDPDVPNMRHSFSDALSEILPWLMPELFSRRNSRGELVFAVPGHDVTSYEYLLKLSKRQAPLTSAITITNVESFGAKPIPCSLCADFVFDVDRYLVDRGDSRITNWAAWTKHAKFRDDASRAGAENWLQFSARNDESKGDRLARSYVARMALARVMYENGIDVFVHPENTAPPPKIQGPFVGPNSLDGITPFFQIPRIVVPAGFNDVVYEPQYVLSPDKRRYQSVIAPGTPRSKLPHPMPIALTFLAGQGDEAVLITVGTAYESATRHRRPPPAFGSVR
jgi:Asp-tRNA(Asn)/Glu-tRNA(Gln) amidotransferase A subunit family amidase